MHACPEYKTDLLSDLYGELDAACAERWRRHVKDCPGCRAERDRLGSMLAGVKEADIFEPLTPAEQTALSMAVSGRRKPYRPGGFAWRFQGWLMPRRLAAFAAACIVVVTAAVYLAVRSDRAPEIPVASADRGIEKLDPVDLEVVENLEILQNFPTIEKLVRVVDDTSGARVPGSENGISGKNRAQKTGEHGYA